MSFEDNRIAVKAALGDSATAFLYEAAGELEAQTKRNVPSKGNWFTEQKNNWTYMVDESKQEAVVGNPQERALWTEFGTGEFSISPKGGRRGWWVYVKETGGGCVGSSYSYKVGKAYTYKEAKRIVAMLRDDGLDAHMTRGQQAYRPLYKAMNALKPKLEKMAKNKFGENMK